MVFKPYLVLMSMSVEGGSASKIPIVLVIFKPRFSATFRAFKSSNTDLNPILTRAQV